MTNRERYQEATFNRLPAGPARQYAGRCRNACEKRGVPIPAWATAGVARPAPKPKPQRRAASGGERTFTAQALAGQAVPPELVAWRCSTGGVAQIDATGGVRFYMWRDGQRFDACFPSVRVAVEAVQTGNIRWVPQKAKPLQTRGKQ